MIDQDKSKQALIEELAEMRRRVAELETSDTDRRQAEEALRTSEAKYRRLYQSMRDAFVSVDMDGFIREYNEAYLKMLGYEPEELMKLRYTDVTPEKWHVFQARIIQEQVLFQGYSDIYEKEYRRKDGTVFPVELRTVLVKGDRDQPTAMWAIIRDITGRKEAEAALQKAHDELDQRVKERTAELAKEHRHLKHLLQSSDHERQLIAYEIHDGLAQQLAGALMQFQAYVHLKDTQAKQAAKAYDAGLTMLQQGHFEARRLIAGVRPPILDESGVVEAVAHLIHEVGRGTEAKIKFDSEVDFDRLDPTLENAIYRIAQEALANACKHGQSERIWVILLQRGDRVRIEIRDCGVGFDPKVIPKSHFGLEGIRQRARLLGGKCTIRSMAGKGTRIMVELPVVPRDGEDRRVVGREHPPGTAWPI